MLSAATFGVLVPFFYYNVFGNADRARKIFMGDTGSLTLGYTLCFLAIKYCQFAPSVVISSDDAFFIAFSTLLLPAFDVIRVVLYRLRNGRNPFEPDKNHIHHKLLAIGLTPAWCLWPVSFAWSISCWWPTSTAPCCSWSTSSSGWPCTCGGTISSRSGRQLIIDN